MNSENLTNLENTGKIEKEKFSLASIDKRYILASTRFKNAKKLLMNNNDDESVYVSAYSELYESYRILCEIMLALCGYRVKQGRGHHETAISTISLTLEVDEMKSIYLRLNRLGRKRNPMEYAGMFDISSAEMEQMVEDVSSIIKRVGSEIDKARQTNALF